jgi:hypothetical protein
MLEESSDEEEATVLLPPHTASSLQQKWSKFIQSHVKKFKSLTIWFPRLSGEGIVHVCCVLFCCSYY